MTDADSFQFPPDYAFGQLQRVLQTAAAASSGKARSAATKRAKQWRSVLTGMADGTLHIGARTPVKNTPSWVTLDVLHGGFATGGRTAGGDLHKWEQDLADELSIKRQVRRSLNNHFVSDAGIQTLLAALDEQRLAIDVAEEAALVVFALLVDDGKDRAASALLEELSGFWGDLRFYPRILDVPQQEPPAGTVFLQSAGASAELLESKTTPLPVLKEREALQVWAPLYDRLVELWADAVDGECPTLLVKDGVRTVTGGDVVLPTDEAWQRRKAAWLRSYEEAVAEHTLCTKHRSTKSNFKRLVDVLRMSEPRPSDLRRVRHALAGTTLRRGSPRSDSRREARRAERERANRPLHVDIAKAIALRLRSLPQGGGVVDISPLLAPVSVGGSREWSVPSSVESVVARSKQATPKELLDDGFIKSAEVLAKLLPQMTANARAAGLSTSRSRSVLRLTYRAFRRRRSLLLLWLQNQVQMDELPWVKALRAYAAPGAGAQAALSTLKEVSLLALTSFPGTLLPNPLVRELSSLSRQANAELPFVEEVAADIFMGTFTVKWEKAARLASEHLEESLYSRYYRLPSSHRWVGKTADRWGKSTSTTFSKMCEVRSKEAKATEATSYGVAANGVVLEQSQILTTHNLAQLVFGLDLVDDLVLSATELATKALVMSFQMFDGLGDDFRDRLRTVKNAAYAFRQGVFFMSLVDEGTQRATLADVARQRGELSWKAVAATENVWKGLRLVQSGHAFDADGLVQAEGVLGQRFLGWTVGPHPVLQQLPRT